MESRVGKGDLNSTMNTNASSTSLDSLGSAGGGLGLTMSGSSNSLKDLDDMGSMGGGSSEELRLGMLCLAYGL